MPSRRLRAIVERGVLYNACSLPSARRVRRGVPRRRRVRAHEPRPRQRLDQPHQHRRPRLELRHLARAPRRRAGDRRAPRPARPAASTRTSAPGSDPAVWKRVARMTLDIAAALPDVTTVNLGGGFKVARVAGEQADRPRRSAARTCARSSSASASAHGRALHLEIEPGTYLVANAGARRGDVRRRGRHGRRGLPLREARHRHDRGHAAVALRRAAPDRRARRGAADATSCSSGRAASRATS